MKSAGLKTQRAWSITKRVDHVYKGNFIMLYKPVVVEPELQWSFQSVPSYTISIPESYSHTVTVDPCPCYPHDLIKVKELADICHMFMPLSFPLYFHVLKHETNARTNAWFTEMTRYVKVNEVDERQLGGAIVLNGKRIPPLPAMTRYLVPHEYGHAVAYAVKDLWKQTDEEFNRDYVKVRGLQDHTFPKSYGPGTWHRALIEIMANDFRLWLADKTKLNFEVDFWPHDVGLPNQQIFKLYDRMQMELRCLSE